MNYLESGLEMILILVMVYQFQENMKQGYRSLFPQIQKLLVLLAVCFSISMLLSAIWYHILLILMAFAASLTYHKQAGWGKDTILLAVSFVAAYGIYLVFDVYLGSCDLWHTYAFAHDLFLLGCCSLIQQVLCYYRNRDYDQMYIYPVFVMLICYLLFLLFVLRKDLLQENEIMIMVMQLFTLMLTSVYRICFCLEISKEKALLAQEKAYTMIGNKERYETIQQENHFIMKNMHDLKKHLELLEHVDRDDETMAHYRKEIQKKTQELLQYQKTGDLLIDKILQLYHPKFMDAGIQCNIESEDIDYGFMDAVDLCAVLCNLLDNAYESCMHCEHRFILLKMRVVSDKVIWKMKNSWNDTQGSVHKIDSFAHGFGLQNMRDIAKKYRGELVNETDQIHGIYLTAVSFSMTDDVRNLTASA